MTTNDRLKMSAATGMSGSMAGLPARALKTLADKPPVALGRTRSRDRRGVLLLVVLSILVLFVVIAVTFVLIAGQFRRGARSEVFTERYTNDSRRQLDDAVYQVFRGSDNVQSVIGPHSLLEDMYGSGGGTYDTYGNGGWTGSLALLPQNPPLSTSTAPLVASGQLLDLTVNPTFTGTFSQINQAWGYYNGMVLTMLNGPAAGVSTRIVGYQYINATSAILRVLAFDGVRTFNSANITDVTTFIGYWNASSTGNTSETLDFIINGRAFNGTGFGYNIATGRVDTMEAPTTAPYFYYALMPNYKYNNYNGGPGGADEDYDAVDYQNMALAYMPVMPTGSAYNSLVNNIATNPNPLQQTLSGTLVPLPSFHRPDLLAWWAQQVDTGMPPKYPWTDSTSMASPNSVQLNRNVIMRPLGPTVLYAQNNASSPIYLGGSSSSAPPDHPLFTGGNPGNPYTKLTDLPYFDPVNGPWDVDNDGDGIADSIWLDLGYPVQTSADGKTYKPLFAFLVLDMDGRLNVNAHGNLAQSQNISDTVDSTNNPLYTTNAQGPFPVTTGGGTLSLSTNPLQNSVPLPRGQGYGPAEINLGYPPYYAAAASNTPPENYVFYSQQQYQQLLYGMARPVPGTSSSEGLDGRYGEYSGGTTPNITYPGNSSTAGSPDDYLAEIKLSDVPQNYFSPFSTLGTATASTMTPPKVNPTSFTAYGTPSDLWGRAAIGLDYRGQPFYTFSAGQLNGGVLTNGAGQGPNEWPNSPYTFNLSRSAVRSWLINGAIDNPFSPAELERLLRRFDIDAYTLPDRLRALMEDAYLSASNTVGTQANPALRQLVTTDSYDLPSPNVLATTDIRSMAGVTKAMNFNVCDLLRVRLQNGMPKTPPPTALQINQQLEMMLPPELMAGQYMDLNRPFGNGRDDTATNPTLAGQNATAGQFAYGLFVVDEPQEYLPDTNVEPSAAHTNTTESAWGLYWNGLSAWLFPPISNTTSVPFILDNYIDWNNNGHATFTGSQLGPNYTTTSLYARQLYARHLYVLMMTLMDQGFVDANWTGDSVAGAGATTDDLTARRVAQWAINAVDYRDADAIMTPFEYDVNPFDGWTVDGILGTSDDTNAERRVVWGCEYPELLLTETFATHDRRVRDSQYDTGGTGNTRFRVDPTTLTSAAPQDQTVDQMRIPQGSLFVELYCPRAASANSSTPATGGSQSVFPGELYTYVNNQWYLNLGAMAPPNSHGYANPVWRLAITASANTTGNPINTNNKYNNVATEISNGMDLVTTTHLSTGSLDPAGDSYNNSILNKSGANYLHIERLAWFTTTPPNASDTTHANTTYYNKGVASGTPVLLQPGGYAVVGPRAYTNFGRQSYALGAASTYPNNIHLSPQQISLLPNNNISVANSFTPTTLSTGYTDSASSANPLYAATAPSGTIAPGTNIQQPLAIICAGPPPTTWARTGQTASLDSNSHTGIGISVSEPLFSASPYYTEPTVQDQGVNQSSPTSYYGNVMDAYGSEATKPTYPDVPFESTVGATTYPSFPLNFDKLYATAVYANYKFVLLQRLANPLLPFNPPSQDPNEGTLNDPSFPVNPYITVDWLPINLTIFNGEALQSSSVQANDGGHIDSDDTVFATPTTPGSFTTTAGFFTAAQRGSNTATGVQGLNLWANTQDSITVAAYGNHSVVFDFTLESYATTLGFLNRGYLGSSGAGHPWTSSAAATPDNPAAPASYVGDPNPKNWSGSAGGTNGNALTFPWINWPNRPFISHYELMQVPASSPTRLNTEVGNTVSNAYSTSSVYGTLAKGATPAAVLTDFPVPFAHLLNFCQSTNVNNPLVTAVAPHFYRIFEYARVPSRFVGTETYLSPNNVGAAQLTDSNTSTAATEQQLFSYLHPPFNKISKYRDPGKVNINTIPHAILNSSPSWSADNNPLIWNSIQDASAGSTTSGPTWNKVATSLQGPYALSGSSKSHFGNYPTMFGSPFRSFASADLEILPSQLQTSTPPPNGPRGIDVTFMRPDPSVPTSMLFDFPPPGSSSTYEGYNAPDRNSYFRYQNLQAMGNLLTTRSNVYAVWVTAGYFQVQPWLGSAGGTTQLFDAAHPDGYQLASELGIDTGAVERHRAFYMFDRTIPVGFQRGMNNNVDRAITVRRFIE